MMLNTEITVWFAESGHIIVALIYWWITINRENIKWQKASITYMF